MSAQIPPNKFLKMTWAIIIVDSSQLGHISHKRKCIREANGLSLHTKLGNLTLTALASVGCYHIVPEHSRVV